MIPDEALQRLAEAGYGLVLASDKVTGQTYLVNVNSKEVWARGFICDTEDASDVVDVIDKLSTAFDGNREEAGEALLEHANTIDKTPDGSWAITEILEPRDIRTLSHMQPPSLN